LYFRDRFEHRPLPKTESILVLTLRALSSISLHFPFLLLLVFFQVYGIFARLTMSIPQVVICVLPPFIFYKIRAPERRGAIAGVSALSGSGSLCGAGDIGYRHIHNFDANETGTSPASTLLMTSGMASRCVFLQLHHALFLQHRLELNSQI